MKPFHILIAVMIAFLCLVQGAAALTASGITTSPSQVNALKPGDIISDVSGIIKLPPSGDQTFAQDDSVEFYTQLDDGKWTVAILINGIENPARTFAGKRATIGGYDLAYPSKNYEVQLKFSLEDGKVPPSFNSGPIILTRVQEIGEGSAAVGATVYVNGTVLNPETLKVQIASAKEKLTSLRAELAGVTEGVDVSAAQAKYDAASRALDQATAAVTSDPSKVAGYISTATTNIESARTAIKVATAGYSLDQAKAQLASVDGLINEFTVNRSIKATDSRLVSIINKRDLAAQAISNANDFFNSANYASAEGKANEGLTFANQAWNLSVDLKTELDKGFTLPGLPNLSALLPIFLIAAVILIIVGVIIYRRKMHWDELG